MDRHHQQVDLKVDSVYDHYKSINKYTMIDLENLIPRWVFVRVLMKSSEQDEKYNRVRIDEIIKIRT